MKFGLCGGFDVLEIAKNAGYDYLEPSVTSIEAMTEEEFAETVKKVQAAGLPVYACNVLFPGAIKLFDAAVTDDMIAAYLEKAFSRLEQLKVQNVVFGSGGARRRPDEVGYADAFCRLVQVTRMIGDAAARHGLTIVIEPLCRKETNMINYMAEGAALMAAVNHPHVKLLADTYHITMDGEAMSDICRLGGVDHVHIAMKYTRLWPLAAEPELAECMSILKKMGYAGGISVEGRSDDRAGDAPRALAVLKKLWDEA